MARPHRLRQRHPERWLARLALRVSPEALARIEAIARARGATVGAVGRALVLRALDLEDATRGAEG